MSLKLLAGLLTMTLGAGFTSPAAAQEVLPFPAKPSGSTAERTMQESIYRPLPSVNRLPKDAPNILIVLIDDVGPAQTGTYGGEIHTPTLSRIANEGVSYNRFHTTAMCSPTRAALLTVRNHHRVGNGQDGTISELLAQNGIPTTTKQQIAALNALGGLDVLGSPKTDNIYHAGWAWAGSTPYQATKLIASHFGGTRNPLAVRWPAKIKHDGMPRAQFLHVNDVVPTIYDIVGITPPRVVNGVPQDQFDGVSFASTLNDPKAKEVKQTQYFEVMGSRGIYRDGWTASAFGPRVPWVPGLPEGIMEWTPDKDKWELYDLSKDWSR